jgi:hypothetical protein
MATIRQKRTFAKLVQQGGNVSRALRESGYSKSYSRCPNQFTNSKGFRELCNYFGLTEELVLKGLVDDIVGKPGKRVGELNLGAEILGMKRPLNQTNVQINLIEGIQEDRNKYAA